MGIFFLLFISNNISPKLMAIKEMSDLSINQRVQVMGSILSIKTYSKSDFQVLKISDSTGKIDILFNSRNNLNLSRNDSVIIIGRITEYKSNLQIQAEKIMCVL
jgi:DNA/RNA endonuclease YhcR with UshA esterase domain